MNPENSKFNPSTLLRVDGEQSRTIKIRKVLGAVFILGALTILVLFYLLPAFRGEVNIPSNFFLGPVRIRIYGVLMAVALLVGYILARGLALKVKICPKHFENALPWIVIFAFLGARLYFVAFSWSYFSSHLLEIFKVWQGGLAIHGGIIGGFLGAFLYAKRQQIIFWKFLDIIAVVAPFMQSLGRWGNFFNQEAYGYPTSLPWRLYISPEHRPLGYLTEKFFHPTFLYESLWDLLIFFLLLYLFQSKTHERQGFLTGVYLILYSLGRFFIEAWRQDSLMIGSMRLEQIVSLLLMALGLGIISWSYVHAKTPLENS